MEARVGFEPTAILVYKTSAIDHYATEPYTKIAFCDSQFKDASLTMLTSEEARL